MPTTRGPTKNVTSAVTMTQTHGILFTEYSLPHTEIDGTEHLAENDGQNQGHKNPERNAIFDIHHINTSPAGATSLVRMSNAGALVHVPVSSKRVDCRVGIQPSLISRPIFPSNS